MKMNLFVFAAYTHLPLQLANTYRHTSTREHKRAHTDAQLLFRWRLDAAYLCPAAVPWILPVWTKGEQPLMKNITKYICVMATAGRQWIISGVTHLIPSGTVEMALLLCLGGFLCRLLHSFFIRKDFLVPLGAETCKSTSKAAEAVGSRSKQTWKWQVTHSPPKFGKWNTQVELIHTLCCCQNITSFRHLRIQEQLQSQICEIWC